MKKLIADPEADSVAFAKVRGIAHLGYKHDQLDSLVRAIEWPVRMSDSIPDNFIGFES